MTPPADIPAAQKGEPQVVAEAQLLAADTAPDARIGWLIPLTIGSAQLMQTFSGTVLTNALPTMARTFDVDPLRLNLAITMYLLAFAVFLPVSGWAADKLGAKRVFLAAIAIFALSSAACGAAQNLTQLIIARLIQGVGASMMMPVGRLVLLRSTPKDQLIGAMAVLTMPAMFGPMLGPLIGGFIVTYWNWRWVFMINLPIAALGLFLVWRHVPNIAERGVAKLDWKGVLYLGGAMSGLIFGFENIGRNMFPPWMVAGFFVGGAVCVWFYFAHARRAANVILDLSVFRIPTFFTAVIGSTFTRIGFAATPFTLAMLLQVGFGMSAMKAGMLTFIIGVGSLTTKAVAPPMLRTFGYRNLLLVNGVITACTTMTIGLFKPTTPQWTIMLVLLCAGFFRSLQASSYSSLTYADVDQDRMSRATTSSSMVNQLNQSIGVGFAAMLLHVLMVLHGQTKLTAETMSPVFWVMGCLALVSLVFVARLPKDAGSEMSGVRSKGRG